MTGDVQVVIEFRWIISHDARVICPLKKIKWSFQKLTRTSLRNVSYKYFHQRNLYKIKTSKNPDLCYGCVQVKPNSVYRLCEQGMYRGSLSVVNWWFALCQAVWWCLWLYVLSFSSEGIRLIVFTDSSSGIVRCFINNSRSLYTEWSVVQMQNLITSEVLAGNKFNREQNVCR